MPPRKSTTEVSSQPTPIQLKCIECVQKTFAKQHFDQLKLDFLPTTTVGFDPYSKTFLERINICEVGIPMRNDVLVLLKEQRLDIFVHLMNKHISANRFPGSFLVQSVLELILKINQKQDETSDKTLHRLQSVALLFETIVDNFPPTWPVCSKAYADMFHSPINMEIDFRKLRMNATDGFFPIILALLDDAFKEVDQGIDDETEFDSMMNFQQFEKIEIEKSCYTKLMRNEKIDRLFIVLNLLVKLMEMDLYLWMQRYPFQTRKFMSNPDTCPLIANLMWKGKQCGECDIIMRDVFKLFTTSIWIEFPDDKTDILARLVNLMSVAVNLSENSESDNLITYPNIKRLTERFATELVKIIETFQYTIKFYVNVIGKIRSPPIRMLVTLRVLGKFTREFENISLRKIVDSISSESYMEYAEKVFDSDATVHRKSDIYPTYDPKITEKMPKYLRIDRDEYLTLVQHLFTSYVDVYRTHDLLAAILSDDKDGTSYANIDQYTKLHEKRQLEKNHRHDLDGIANDAKQLRLTATELASTDPIPVTPITQCRNVYLETSDLVRCQEDLEHFLRLKEIVHQNVLLEGLSKAVKF